MKKPLKTGKADESLINEAIEILEYVNNQRIFLVGKPTINLFNYLICGYDEVPYHDILKNKISKKND
ncbi:hypothetical protein [Emticicia sp. 17c]|uniref:hypothetical protein n=1 Tax=Emticicia sp. 17c TaxID=3127704 RepID=UPI00301DB9BC